MRHLPKFTTLVAAAVALAPGLARAAEPPCLTAGEFTTLSTYALPSLIDGAGLRCAASLPADSFLRSGAGALASRYAAIKPSVWPGAKAAFLKLSSGAGPEAADMLKSMPDQTVQQMVDGFVKGRLAQDIPVDRCATIDRLLHLLSPLPPESTAEIIGLAVGLGSRADHPHVGKISICKA